MALIDVADRDMRFAVRDAQVDDATACRMLLPRFEPAGKRVVAVALPSDRVIGVAAATQSRRRTPHVGPGVDVHVIPPCRRRGIGRELMASLMRTISGQGCEVAYTTHKVDMASDEFLAWKKLGFEVCETVEDHVLPLSETLQLLAPMVQWMRQRGDIPANAEVVPLFRSDLPDVLNLHLHHLGGDRATLWSRLHGNTVEGFHPKYSCTLRLAGQTIGCLLARRQSATEAAVDAVVVAPEFRMGWANALLKLAAIEGAAGLGITHFHFATFDHYHDTRRLAARLGGGVTLRKALLMRRAVD